MTKRVLFLVGPTGSGKTQLSLCLAKRLGAEILSADSMLVYRGMDIGTAKPSREDRKRVRHHLIDLVSPRRNFSVSEHRELALEAIESILKRGRLPLVVGGSGLYVSAIWKGLSPHPGTNMKLREKLNQLVKEKGLEDLYQELERVDPHRAKQIHPNDRRRILRALEIVHTSGKTPSEWYQKRTSLGDLGYSVKVIGVARDRRDLYDRINLRVESMFRKGLLREVERLKQRGFSKTARQALGYREVLDSKGTRPFLKELIQQRTRQFAKRQLTWFRREKDIHWVRWERDEAVGRVCGKMITEIRKWLENESSL